MAASAGPMPDGNKVVVLGQTAGKVAWSSAEPVRWSVRAREILAG